MHDIESGIMKLYLFCTTSVTTIKWDELSNVTDIRMCSSKVVIRLQIYEYDSAFKNTFYNTYLHNICILLMRLIYI